MGQPPVLDRQEVVTGYGDVVPWLHSDRPLRDHWGLCAGERRKHVVAISRILIPEPVLVVSSTSEFALSFAVSRSGGLESTSVTTCPPGVTTLCR